MIRNIDQHAKHEHIQTCQEYTAGKRALGNRGSESAPSQGKASQRQWQRQLRRTESSRRVQGQTRERERAKRVEAEAREHSTSAETSSTQEEERRRRAADALQRSTSAAVIFVGSTRFCDATSYATFALVVHSASRHLPGAPRVSRPLRRVCRSAPFRTLAFSPDALCHEDASPRFEARAFLLAAPKYVLNGDL